jgi:Concanavalin A-like lectin/glucanases superfamily
LFAGTVDEVRVWDYARTQDEILSTLYVSLNGDEPGLIGYWPLDEGSGQIAADKSEHGRDGTLGSTPNVDENDPDWVTESSSGPCVPPPAGLVSWWSGDRTADDVQGTNNGTLLNGASFRKGMVGPGFLFDGVNDVVQVGDTPSLKMTTATTLECWIYPTASRDECVIANREGEYEFGRFADGTIRWAFANTDPGWFWTTTGFVAPQRSWTHIAITYENGLITTYGNGVQVHQYSGSGAIGDADPTLNDFRVGNRQAFPNRFPGIVDELKVYNRALSPPEVAAIYAAGSNGNCKPEIFVASIDPSFQVRGPEYAISTSIAIHDVVGVGIEDATVQVKTTFPDGSESVFPITTNQLGEAVLSFHTRSTGLYEFKVRRVSHPTRIYDASLNIETIDTLLIP